MNAHQRSLPALAVFLTAIGSAAVMTACGPEKGDPVMPRMDTPATAAAPATRTQPVAERRAPPVERHLGRVTGVEAIGVLRARARWLIAINAVLLVLLAVGVALSYGRFGGG